MRTAIFEPRHAEAFRDLNLAWIEEYFRVEDVDRQVLDDPDAFTLPPRILSDLYQKQSLR